jgi:hypothetical protein
VEIAVSKPRPAKQGVRDIVFPSSQSDSDEFCLSMSTDKDSVNLSLYESLTQTVIARHQTNILVTPGIRENKIRMRIHGDSIAEAEVG